MKMGIFRAVVVHPGQNVSTRKQVCGKWLQDNHRTSDCMNDTSHKSGNCPMTSDDKTQDEVDKQPEPEKEPEIQVHLSSGLTGELTLGAVPTPHSSPREHKKADRKIKHLQDKPPTGINSKTIQDYFKASDKTPFKDKQTRLVRNSPPTPIEEQKSQKKSKMRDHDGEDDSSSDSEHD